MAFMPGLGRCHDVLLPDTKGGGQESSATARTVTA
jgi:hypothetical protein